MHAIFLDNVQLCNEVTEKVVSHFITCIETKGRQVHYLRFLQTIVKSEGQYNRKCQDLVMAEVSCAPLPLGSHYLSRVIFFCFLYTY